MKSYRGYTVNWGERGGGKLYSAKVVRGKYKYLLLLSVRSIKIHIEKIYIFLRDAKNTSAYVVFSDQYPH